MAKITDGDNLVVNTEITIDVTGKTFTLNEAGNLIAKDGVTIQAVYSKFIKLWETSAYNKYPFPMYTIDAKSGQYQFGTDGGSYNGWKPANDSTRQMLRDGGWSEYSSGGALNRQYVGIVSLGEVNTGAQLYYQTTTTGSPVNFTFEDGVNEGIQVLGDIDNGNFNTRTYFQAFVREYGKNYKASTLDDTGQSSTGAFTVNVLLSNEDDLKITATDSIVATGSTYTGMTIEFFGSDQMKTIGSGSYPFRKIIQGANGTLEEIYTKMQYLLRQDSDIDSGAGSVNGKTAAELCYFVGDTLYTTLGVFIEGIQSTDVNRIVFLDQTGSTQQYPYSSAVSLNSNSFLTQGGTGYYRVYFTNDEAGSDLGYDYGTVNAITVKDASNNDIQGTITSSLITFTYDYDGNVQRGAGSEGKDAPITIVAGNKGVAKPVVATGTITRSKGISISLVAEQDRAYVD
jgi:hypothetical protein